MYTKTHLLVALLNIVVATYLVINSIQTGGFRLYASVTLLIVSSIYATYCFAKSKSENIP
jgi:hypothetical protein